MNWAVIVVGALVLTAALSWAGLAWVGSRLGSWFVAPRRDADEDGR